MGDFEKDQARLLALYEEIDSDNGEINSGSEVDDEENNEVDQSEEDNTVEELVKDNGNLEAKQDESNTDRGSQGLPFYLGKDKASKWFKMPIDTRPNIRTRAENIISHLPAIRRPFRDAKLPIDCWKYFITDDMIIEITLHTNKKIQENAASYSEKNKYKVKQTNPQELYALFGLLYLAGFYRSGRQNLKDLWYTDDTGVIICRNTMALYRFNFLLACLRFDDTETRAERKKCDKLAPIRLIFDQFVSHCKAVYSPGEYLTIDERLPAFRGRCSFRQYIPNKPSKYGLKIFTLVDARCFYTVNMEVYVGMQPEGPFRQSNKSEDIVIRLIAPISKSGRNITFDNWFTSYNLMKRLLYEYRLTAVGTVRKNKRELPPQMILTKNRKVPSSMFGFQKEVSVVSYVGKKIRT